ncbi:MAG: 2Fe-2S iron-sulfur cluster binding domain-containing protein [Holosporales bacterium]|jgi:2Fe-2S ferredoxin|nr:2Fe-2S iron-sulfur cluster binding domain-containing protein [Holosporales bacterium]
MVRIIFKTSAGESEIEANVGETILGAANRCGVKLFGGCSGAGVCGTCHVLIDPSFLDKAGEPSDHEADLVGVLPKSAPNSRLACQVVITEALDGMTVTIP